VTENIRKITDSVSVATSTLRKKPVFSKTYTGCKRRCIYPTPTKTAYTYYI